MSWSLTLGRIAGTEVRIHFTFFLLVAWFAASAGSTGGQAAALDAVLFILAVFACIVAHEFGHILVARRFGIKTRDITLLPIGGVASLERMPRQPSQELLVALAGPAVNVVIALALLALAGGNLGTLNASTPGDIQQIDFITRLAIVNIALVVFNLLPAFPMDGGRVLRAVLSFGMDRARATRVAASIGQIVAFGLGFLGLFGNPLLIFIALFVFLAAGHEAYAVELDEATRGAATGGATITSFATLKTDATVGAAVETLLATEQREFPITDGGGHVRGVLTRDGMLKALAVTGPTTPVMEVMEREVATVNRRAPLSEAVNALQSGESSLVGVVDDDDRIVGIVTKENVAEYLMVAQASRGWQFGRGTGGKQTT